MRRHRSDRGSISILFAAGMLAIMSVIGLTVNGGGQIRTQQLANDIAAEAARAGAQVIDLNVAVTGTNQELLMAQPADPTKGPNGTVMAFLKYVRTTNQVDIVLVNSGTKESADRTQLFVWVAIQYHPTIGISQFHSPIVYGSATAKLVLTPP